MVGEGSMHDHDVAYRLERPDDRKDTIEAAEWENL